MRVLGIDPGTVNTGWGVVEGEGSRLAHRSSGVIRCQGALPQRLMRIYDALQRIFKDHEPHCVSLEKTFVGDNVQTAFRLGEARGAILVAAAQAGVTVCEYAPAEIKVAVAGSGRAAKEQMQMMVARLLGLSDVLASDQADALGAAICHLHTSRFAARVGDAVVVEALSRQRRRTLRR
ncbi:MAG TPA: crossover junction endodeoxyribonuclease RuvC [Candidatus Acidoferrales bacterium]|nr:crossover junction endodeoxyribonuclease RuvC [Candidatus Acidoferrales bacterium]